MINTILRTSIERRGIMMGLAMLIIARVYGAINICR